jgi:hypothetical protein
LSWHEFILTEIKNGSLTRAKTITITIINLKEKTIGIVADQTMSVNERSQVYRLTREQLSITVCQYYYFQQQRHQCW